MSLFIPLVLLNADVVDCITPLKHPRYSFVFWICSLIATITILSNSIAALAKLPSAASSSPSSGDTDVSKPGATSSIAKAKGTNAYPYEWKYLNEQEWIVDGIGRDIAGILGYAKYGREGIGFSRSDVSLSTKTLDLNAGTYSYSLTIGKKLLSSDYKLTLVDYIWSPKAYLPFAKEILLSLKLQPSAASQVPDEFLNNLSKGELTVLFSENERISKAISQNPLDASLHEQAALLLGVFTSLGLCGTFNDVRPLISRISAHLALAKALNQEKLGSVGELASVILEMWSSRNRIAFESVRHLESRNPSPTEKSILRAIKMCITNDYRVYDEAHSTQLEDLLFCEQYTMPRPAEDGLKRFKNHVAPLSHQWRIMLSAGHPTVSSGSVIAQGMISSEISEFIRCRNAYKKVQDDNFSSFCEELNLQPGGCLSNRGEIPALNVLSWELICYFFQRQIAYAITIEYQYYACSLGMRQRARQVQDDAYKNFSKLTLFPFITHRFSLNDSESESVYASIKKLLAERPEAISSQIWQRTIQIAATEGTALSPSPEVWFDPVMPMGTVFVERYDHKNCPKSLAFYEGLRRLDPFDDWLAMAWAHEKYGEFPTAEQYREAFGPLVDYNSRAIHLVCRGEIRNPEKFIELAEKIADQDPNIYFDIADYCVLNHIPEKAAEYYEKAFNTARDAVAVANRSDWLALYLFDSGEEGKAEEVAHSAASVYSRRGLQTLAHLYERQGKLNEAEAQYKLIEERYDNTAPLLAFYLRYREKEVRYQKPAAELLAKKFPSGLKKVTLSSFKGAPEEGLLVLSTWWISDSPLKRNTIIVGINGYAVTSESQYDVVKALGDQRNCSVIYWDGEKYQERTEPTIQHNSLGVSVKSYEKPK